MITNRIKRIKISAHFSALNQELLHAQVLPLLGDIHSEVYLITGLPGSALLGDAHSQVFQLLVYQDSTKSQ